MFRNSALNIFHWSSQTPNKSIREEVNKKQNIIALLLLKKSGLMELQRTISWFFIIQPVIILPYSSITDIKKQFLSILRGLRSFTLLGWCFTFFFWHLTNLFCSISPTKHHFLLVGVSGLWHHVLLQVDSTIPEEYAASIFRDEISFNPESESSVLLQNIVGICPQDCIVLQPEDYNLNPNCHENLITYKI